MTKERLKQIVEELVALRASSANIQATAVLSKNMTRQTELMSELEQAGIAYEDIVSGRLVVEDWSPTRTTSP